MTTGRQQCGLVLPTFGVSPPVMAPISGGQPVAMSDHQILEKVTTGVRARPRRPISEPVAPADPCGCEGIVGGWLTGSRSMMPVGRVVKDVVIGTQSTRPTGHGRLLHALDKGKRWAGAGAY